MSIEAVIFDLGGVVLGSPLHAIRAYERELGLAQNAINRVAAATAPHGAWSRLERGELEMETFYAEFEADCLAAGHTISARDMMARMAGATEPRESMLEAIRRIRAAGLRAAALTNNWASPEESSNSNDGTRALSALFDVFVESSVEGLRKPDPRIYELTCERLAVAPTRAAFLDDIGFNLKPARALGMTTIKVDEPEPALEELGRVLGLRLLD
ncbi:MAG: HAD-IA family hydrolase [Deltaproteobacteria bacterium]|jgi:putative hydrolase of the HAD superfamily|nr:HAD-IA family hydrolase [Deltaproteobacteria bacterium]MBW2384173.1 HAD-IA family hydrolase [Deltaproteobacteria bacterium]MBW2697968.1 HAD-IA family hydrolase [Deltaproteobacteria bacterium]